MKLTVYGGAHSLWWHSQFIVVLTINGGTQFMVVLTVYGGTQFMAVLKLWYSVCGGSHSLWWYSQFMVVLTVYGGTHSLRNKLTLCCVTINTMSVT